MVVVWCARAWCGANGEVREKRKDRSNTLYRASVVLWLCVGGWVYLPIYLSSALEGSRESWCVCMVQYGS